MNTWTLDNGIDEIRPRNFYEIEKVFSKFIELGEIILDISIMNPDDAQRSVDFFAGGVFALNGEKERLDKRSFLFSISKSTMRNYLKNIFN